MATPALPSNRCIGTLANGEPDRKFLCLKQFDANDNPVYTCTTYRLFYVRCPRLNQLCNQLSNAYLPAITMCNQRIF